MIVTAVLSLIQVLVFYIAPLFVGRSSPIGMVGLLLWMTFIFSFLIGLIARNPTKYVYPFAVALLFLPSVFLYYNSSALIHCLWYFIVSLVGVLIGGLLGRMIVR